MRNNYNELKWKEIKGKIRMNWVGKKRVRKERNVLERKEMH